MEIAIGVISLIVTIVGIYIAYLQLRRTPESPNHEPKVEPKEIEKTGLSNSVEESDSGNIEIVAFRIDKLCNYYQTEDVPNLFPTTNDDLHNEYLKYRSASWTLTPSDKIHSYYCQDRLNYFSDAARAIVSEETPKGKLKKYLIDNPVNRIPNPELVAKYKEIIPQLFTYFQRKVKEYSFPDEQIFSNQTLFLQYYFYLPDKFRSNRLPKWEDAKHIITGLAHEIFEREKSLPFVVEKHAYAFVKEKLPTFNLTVRSSYPNGVILHDIETEALAVEQYMGIEKHVLEPVHIYYIEVPSEVGIVTTQVNPPLAIPNSGISFGIRLFKSDNIYKMRILRITLCTDKGKKQLPIFGIDL